jgi:hypothetical protein
MIGLLTAQIRPGPPGMMPRNTKRQQMPRP